jgi:DNA-binding transcriptional regulator YiaG
LAANLTTLGALQAATKKLSHGFKTACASHEKFRRKTLKLFDPMNFAEQLKAERERLGLTQAGAAAFLEVSPRAVWKWEHGNEPLVVTQEGVLARLKKAKAWK